MIKSAEKSNVRELRSDMPNAILTLEDLVGKRVSFFGLNYIYVGGKVIHLNKEEGFVVLEDPSIVYETGKFTGDGSEKYKDEQTLGVKTFNVMLEAIESFGVLK